MVRDLIYGLCKRYVKEDMIELCGFEQENAAYMIIGTREKSLFGLIFLNKNDPLEEQVKGILHEVFHFHPDFIAYTGGLADKTLDRNEEIESQIEDRAQKTYEERPDIVSFVGEELVGAYKIFKERLKQKAAEASKNK